MFESKPVPGRVHLVFMVPPSYLNLKTKLLKLKKKKKNNKKNQQKNIFLRFFSEKKMDLPAPKSL